MKIAETGLPITVGDVHSDNINRPRRSMFRKLPYGAAQSFAPLCLDSKDSLTVKDAFSSRLLRKIPPYDPVELAKFKQFVIGQVSTLPLVDPIKVDFEEWLTSRKGYNESRRNQLREAYYQLNGGPPTRRQCSHIDTFVKTESYPENKHARMINSRSDAFKAWAGPWIHAAENIVYSNFPEFIKHTPVLERPQKILDLAQAGRSYFATDFTAFESHFIPEIQNACENVLLNHLLQRNNYVHLITKTNSGQNRMRTREGVSATVVGRRMSGDLWTSLGNGFTNLMLAKYIVYKKGGFIEGFVEGDDGIFSSTVDLTTEDYSQLGFTIKIERVVDPCQASFCGMIFGEDGDIIRDPRKFLSTFAWTHSFIHGRNSLMLRLLKAKALSTLCETPSCPIVSCLAHEALKLCASVDALYVDDGYTDRPQSEDLRAFEPKPSTRLLFQQVYGVSIPDQLKIEDLIRTSRFGEIQTVLTPHKDVCKYSMLYLEVT